MEKRSEHVSKISESLYRAHHYYSPSRPLSFFIPLNSRLLKKLRRRRLLPHVMLPPGIPREKGEKKSPFFFSSSLFL